MKKQSELGALVVVPSTEPVTVTLPQAKAVGFSVSIEARLDDKSVAALREAFAEPTHPADIAAKELREEDGVSLTLTPSPGDTINGGTEPIEVPSGEHLVANGLGKWIIVPTDG